MISKRQLKEQRDNAEERAVTHFRKLFAIEQILIEADVLKTPSVIVVDKIKEVIQHSHHN